MQLFRMLLEIYLVELPTNPHFFFILCKDGNEVWRISVRPGVPILSLYLFYVLGGRKVVDVSDESLIVE